MAKVRAFVAIELDASLRTALAVAQDALRRQVSLSVRWVRPEGIHLTLQFLGSIQADLLKAIEGRLEAVAGRSSPFRIQLGGLGGFPSLERPSVLWVGLAGEVDLLSTLQARLETELESLGLPKEGRPFHPHLTLGRVRTGHRAGGRPAASGLAQAIGTPIGEQLVERISLMKSSLTADGARYTQLAFANLATGLSAQEP